jgi:membrane protein DedA with SNARE-associated domain
VPYPELIWPMVGFFGALVLAGAGFPIPEELPTVGAGIWVASNPDLGPARWLVLPVCFAGVLLSDVMLYGIGRLWGPRLLTYKWVARVVTPDKREKIEHNFHRYGVRVLLAIRWVPGIRSPMFITAGVMRLPFVRFVLADGVAAVVGHSLLFFLAWWFGDQFKQLVETFESGVSYYLKPLLILVGLGGVSAFLLWHFLRHPVSTGDPEEDLPKPLAQPVKTLLRCEEAPQLPECQEDEADKADQRAAGKAPAERKAEQPAGEKPAR